jgi:hypothetical protein
MGHPNAWGALDLHHSPFKRSAFLMPILGSLKEYRATCVVLLYALSIVVRYRPSLWRRVQEGDLDHLRVLIEAFLFVVERILPEQFLETVSGSSRRLWQPGLDLMSEAEAADRVSPMRRARQFRDGLIIALLAARPMRRSTLLSMQFDQHFDPELCHGTRVL